MKSCGLEDSPAWTEFQHQDPHTKPACTLPPSLFSLSFSSLARTCALPLSTNMHKFREGASARVDSIDTPREVSSQYKPGAGPVPASIRDRHVCQSAVWWLLACVLLGDLCVRCSGTIGMSVVLGFEKRPLVRRSTALGKREGGVEEGRLGEGMAVRPQRAQKRQWRGGEEFERMAKYLGEGQISGGSAAEEEDELEEDEQVQAPFFSLSSSPPLPLRTACTTKWFSPSSLPPSLPAILRCAPPSQERGAALPCMKMSCGMACQRLQPGDGHASWRHTECVPSAA